MNIKTSYLVLVVALIFTSVKSWSQCGQLTWSDEFTSSTVDQSKWTFADGNNSGWGNAELQNYTNSPNNVRIENGRLVIEAKNDNGYYTSGRLTTSGKHNWKYGRFEMRAKLPAGTGLWPAFWMLPEGGTWPLTGELDVMENRGDELSRVAGTVHYGDFFPNNRHDGTPYDLPSEQGTFVDDFHTFAMEWEVGEIRWYVDDNLYKTETKNPNTLSPPSNNNPWPWDEGDWYIMVNLAVGGPNTPYTGYQDPNFGSSGIMEVDYIRVYDGSRPSLAIEGPTKVFDLDEVTYSVPSNNGESYSWSVPSDATLVSGQGSSSIVVNWGNSEGGEIGVAITHGSGAECPGNAFNYTKSVEVFSNSCTFNFENFDEDATMGAGYVTGDLEEVTNPGGNSVNNSSNVGRYARNSAEQYDVIIFENALVDPATDFVSGTKKLFMDVRSSAPIGTNIEIQLGNSDYAGGGFPNGVHSVYSATTTATNTWESLEFTHISSPDPNGASYEANINRMIVLFNPNSYTGTTYYFDNLRRELSASPSVLALSGESVLDPGATGVVYTATGGASGSSYEWTLPVGATITAGEGTSSVTVDFASSGGLVSVAERTTAGCTGDVKSLPVSVGGNSCALWSDEYDDLTVESEWISSTLGGFSYTEAGSDWKINSTGHDQWASILIDINDGQNAASLDFTNPINVPFMEIKAKATEDVLFVITFIDEDGVAAQNQYLTPLNNLVLETEFQTFQIDFDGQFWDEFTGGGEMDQSKISQMRISINPGYTSFPATNPNGGTFDEAFVGDIWIDYIRIGQPCEQILANFTADLTSLCGTGNTVVFNDNSQDSESASYSWDFGDGASPATASTAGPHTVTYNTAGFKSISLSLNSGESIKLRENYIYVSESTSGCLFADDFEDALVGDFWSVAGNFTIDENTTSDAVTISTTGHDEYESFKLDVNDGTDAKRIDFNCNAQAPIVNIRAKASSNCVLRVGLADASGVVTQSDDLVTANTLELTSEYQDFQIDFTGMFVDGYSEGAPFTVDSAAIASFVFLINPGFSSFPYEGTNGTYDATFSGDIDVEFLTIGNDCLPIVIGYDELTSFDGEVYPNPSADAFFVQPVVHGNGSIDVMNQQGQILSTTSFKNGESVMIGNDLQTGTYILRVISEGNVQTTTVVKF